MRYEQTFMWKPKSKARPRMSKTGHTYTEPATRLAEEALAEQYNGPRLDGPVNVDAKFSNTEVFWSIEDCADYINRRLVGDVDNYFKLLADSLNGIAYIDDRQIVSFTASKL